MSLAMVLAKIIATSPEAEGHRSSFKPFPPASSAIVLLVSREASWNTARVDGGMLCAMRGNTPAFTPSFGATSGGIGNNAPSWRKQMQTEINAKVPMIRTCVLCTFTRCCSRSVIIFPHHHVARSPSRSLPSSSPHHLRNIATQHPTLTRLILWPSQWTFLQSSCCSSTSFQSMEG